MKIDSFKVEEAEELPEKIGIGEIVITRYMDHVLLKDADPNLYKSAAIPSSPPSPCPCLHACIRVREGEPHP